MTFVNNRTLPDVVLTLLNGLINYNIFAGVVPNGVKVHVMAGKVTTAS